MILCKGTDHLPASFMLFKLFMSLFTTISPVSGSRNGIHGNLRYSECPNLLHVLWKLFIKLFPDYRKSTGWDRSDKSGTFTLRCTPFNTLEVILFAGKGNRYVRLDPFGRAIAGFYTGVMKVFMVLLREFLPLSES